ncbi:MAG: protein translocase subunit SecDF [Rikenellaceae bacterium]|nr:protein translocase subunit SecDF [Rikenellaceae bacterium]
MQSKGAIRFFAIILAIACLYQLSFTFVTNRVERKAVEYARQFPENEQSSREQHYLDSMKTQQVYNLGITSFTYQEAKEKELNLGLDLRGGMNVMLEISLQDVVKALSNNNPDPNFNQAMAMAAERAKTSTRDYITLFAEAYEEVVPGGRLSFIFNTPELREYVTPESSNAQVVRVLHDQANSAIENSYNVLRNRIDRFGVAQPNIQRLENSGRILVELPGVKEPERVRKLLQGTASLEFWATYDNQEILPALYQANAYIKEYQAAQSGSQTLTEEIETEETAQAMAAGETPEQAVESAEQSLLDQLAASEEDSSTDEAYEREFPLLSKLVPMPEGYGAVVGRAFPADTATVNQYLNLPQVKAMFPRDLALMWGVKPEKVTVDNSGRTQEMVELYAIRKNTRDGMAPLDGGYVTDARENPGQFGGYEVSMSMNMEGAKKWSRLTADNIGKSIAIVLDGYVYSAPRVNNEISGGQSQITGNFTINDARDLANVLKSGKLPAPARIVQEAVVGPSLGQESINAGMTSFLFAFVLILIYMILFYNKAGWVASFALITNLFFLFGVFASFGFVLTLPGIAGIVLTMGMAVDANVIIYERIKEELRAGKSVAQAIKDGYGNAYSAILDGQITTLITGIVLFVFGSGPVQGFATTLIIGILTSLFTSISITRMFFEGMLKRKRNITFSNNFSRNFLANTRIDFISKRKITYIVSGILLLASFVSLAVRGMSYGVDFSGGRAYVVRFDQDVTAQQVRDVISDVFEESMEVKQYGADEQHQFRIITQYRFDEEGEDVTDEVNRMMYEALGGLYRTPLSYAEFETTATNDYGIISADKVGPSVASDITRNAVIAIVFALIVIGIYIAVRFKRWQWAMGGVVALLHDTLITIGIFSMLHGLLPFNMDVDQSFIAAILTIIGYSINNTVVIFDRIREERRNYPKRSLKDNINTAVNSTLARTVNSSGTTIVVLLAIFIFGGEVIRGFVFALLCGMIIGTFSSIFVSTPVAYDLMKRKGIKE